MRQFAEFWQPFLICSPTASKLKIKDLQREIEYDRFALSKWSPTASEIVRDEFLGISFSHHMEILHKTKDIKTRQAIKAMVAIELKVGKFKPSYLGQLYAYLQVLDDKVRA